MLSGNFRSQTKISKNPNQSKHVNKFIGDNLIYFEFNKITSYFKIELKTQIKKFFKKKKKQKRETNE